MGSSGKKLCPMISRMVLVDLFGQRDLRRYPDFIPRQRGVLYRPGLPAGRASVADGTPERALRVMTVFRNGP
jgi:hypothetical protein